MANPFMDAIQRGRTAVKAQLDPQGLARDRAAVDAENMRQGLLPIIASLRPDMAALVQNKDAFNAAMQNPSAYYNLSSASANAEPTAPAAMAGDDILELFSRAEQFQAAGEPRRAELMLNAAMHKAGIDTSQGGGSGAFGGSLEGRSFDIVTQLAPLAQAGQLTPDQERLLDVSLGLVSRPKEFRDPLTGDLISMPPNLPPFITSLIEARKVPGGTSAVRGATPTATPAPVAVPPAAEPGAEPPAADVGLEWMKALPSGATLFDQAGNLTGPDSFIRRVGPQIPGFGALTNEATGAERFAEEMTELLVDALKTEREDDVRGQAETESLRERFGFQPEVFNTPEVFQDKAAQAWVALDEREKAIYRRLSGAAGQTSSGQKRRDLDTLRRIEQIKSKISYPVVQRPEDVELYEPGAKVIARDPETKLWRKYTVPEK